MYIYIDREKEGGREGGRESERVRERERESDYLIDQESMEKEEKVKMKSR